MTNVPQTTRAAFYNGILGETKSKFDFRRHKRSTSIQESSFFNWSNSNMYRTSYNEMANRVSAHCLLIFHSINQLSARTMRCQATRVTGPRSLPTPCI